MVSSFGRILSMGHTQEIHPYGNKSIMRQGTWGYSFLKPIIHHNQRSYHYFNVSLRKDGKSKRFLWHRVVAEAFIPNPHSLPHIDHINGDKSNNMVSNLRWCDGRTNMNNPITRSRISISKQGKPALNKKAVVAIYEDHIMMYPSAFETTKDGFSPRNVGATCRGEAKTHHGIRWMFLSDYETLVNKSKNSSIPEK